MASAADNDPPLRLEDEDLDQAVQRMVEATNKSFDTLRDSTNVTNSELKEIPFTRGSGNSL
jgi:hypothetical protein